MKSKIILVFSLLVFLLTTVTAAAGSRYHGSSRHYFHPKRNYHYNNYHHYSSSYLWAELGLGLLTGIIVGAMLSQPRRQHTVSYAAPRVIYQRPLQTAPATAPHIAYQQELILKRVTTTAALLNVRSLPDLGAPIIMQVPQGAMLGVVGAAPEWLYIKLPSGQHGWVKSLYTTEFEGPKG